MNARIHVGVFRNVKENLVDEYVAVKCTASIAKTDMELARSSEMPVPFRRTTRRSVPENITINSHLHENLESHTMKSVGNGGKVPHIFRRGSRWSLVASFIPPYPPPPRFTSEGEKNSW